MNGSVTSTSAAGGTNTNTLLFYELPQASESSKRFIIIFSWPSRVFGASARVLEMEAQEAKRADAAAASPVTGGEVVKPAGGDAGAVVKPTDGPSAPPADKAAMPTGSADRDAILAKVELDRKLSMIKAWEESEKSKAENKAQKKLSSILAWENTRKAAVEAKLRTREEKLERKKAEYAEKMRNQVAAIHKAAEEKRATVEAMRHEEIIKYEEMAAKHRSKGTTPTKFLSCFGS
uniref:Remorin C-terminal domain-containing protein n=2 Tax=Leersia perrieri TaxID=77586 RepID=A0A0D9VMW7_9ORYZ